MKLISIPSLMDNYIWLLHNNIECIIIDPGESKPVLKILKKLNLTIVAILLTHYHHDHINGVPEILSYYTVPVYGPNETKKKGSTILVKDKDIINILNLKFTVLSLPGHTLGHIGFYNYPWLFCGDTLFSGGCGKILKGKEKTMYQSIQKIKKLNKNILICSGHEYTLSNLEFSISIIPEDIKLISYKKYIERIRKNKQPTLPTKLKNELEINLFLRCHENIIRKKIKCSKQDKEWKIFSKLREYRDKYSSKNH